MIAAKCSMHFGHRWNIKHNKREFDKDKWNKDGHIDESRSHLDKELTYTPLNKFFDETFGDALVAFNEKNYEKHPDRLIGFKTAAEYEKATPQERREKAVKAYSKEQKKKVQEGIFQLGDHEEYLQLIQQVGQVKTDEIHKQYLTELYHKFVADNPTLKVFSADIHIDEIGDGTPHLHLDFLPVSESSRGLTTKVSLEGALKALGFKREKEQKYAETPYKQWLNDRRAAFEDLAQDFCNKHKLGIVIIPSEKSTAQHEQPQDWRARQQRVKASNGKLAELTGKDKKMQLEAAEYIIGNAQAVAESITKEAAKKEQKAADDIAAARQVAASATAAVNAANELQQKTLNEQKQVRSERAALERERAENAANINRQVRRRLADEQFHRDMSKVSAAQRRRMAQIGVKLDENGLTISNGKSK